MRFIYLFVMLLLTLSLTAQEDFNLELVANVQFNESGNDIWGYVHSDGTEFAIVGTRTMTRIFNLSDPTNPREVLTIAGGSTTWRDMKSWEDHIYVTADEVDDGLLVIDMSEVSTDSIRFQFLTPEVPTANGNRTLGLCHNLYVDENGYCYLAGCDTGMNKAIIFDLNADKWTPPIVGVHGGGGAEYAHDLMVKDNVMFSSEINVGDLVIFDVTDKANIVELGRVKTSFDYTHNAWVSDDGNFVFTTDERGNAFVDAYDISNLPEITRLDMFQPAETAGNGVIPHNTHYINGYLVTSWYTDGVVITDASRPDNMIKTGSYDTFLGADGGFRGCWGVYPWLPSGLVIANDINSGLYVLQPQYIRGCYLEGTVTDAVTGAPINGVTVEIIDQDGSKTTDVFGEYKTGLATAGNYRVRFSNINYKAEEADAVLVNGELTILDIQMTQPARFSVTGSIVDAVTGAAIANGKIRFQADPREFEAVSDGNGSFLLETFEEEYEVIVAAWGYLHKAIAVFDPVTDEAIFRLEPGYQDDFVLDLDWTVENTAGAGEWTRGVPNGTVFQGAISNINMDIGGDLGQEAYVTGNEVGGAGNDDVDDGSTILTSPAMLLASYADPIIEFRTYFFNAGGQGSQPNDQMSVELTDGITTVLLADYEDNTGDWTETIRFNVRETGLDLAQPITISYTVSDDDPGHLVEAALDVFKVVEAASVSTDDISDLDFITIYPNPTADFINIHTELEGIAKIQLFNNLGQLISEKQSERIIDVSDLESGVYLIVIDMESGKDYSSRVIVK